MTHLQEAYDALIEKMKEKLIKSHQENDALSHENTLREMVMTKFVYDSMGSEGLLAMAALVDEHERKERKDPKYNYGFVEMVKQDYPEKKGTWTKSPSLELGSLRYLPHKNAPENGESLEKLQLCVRTHCILVSAGINTIEKLICWSPRELKHLPGFGDVALNEVRDQMKKHQYFFNSEVTK